MRYPAFLPEQSTIGFVAPSFGAYIEALSHRLSGRAGAVQAGGLSGRSGPNCFEGCGIGISIPRRSADRS